MQEKNTLGETIEGGEPSVEETDQLFWSTKKVKQNPREAGGIK